MKYLDFKFADTEKLTKEQMKTIKGGTDGLCPYGVQIECFFDYVEGGTFAGEEIDTTLNTCRDNVDDLDVSCSNWIFGTKAAGCICASSGN